MAPEAPAAGSARCIAAFRARFGRPPAWLGWAPGRVNLIGEHTDYNEGLAMPAAIDRWVLVACAWREDRRLRIRAEDLDAELEAGLGELPGAGRPTWERFALGCLAEFSALQPLPRGLDALVAGDVPLGAGLSSSAAVELAWMNGLRVATGAPIADLELCRAAQRVEHRHLGLASGLLDQLASQLSRAGSLLVIDFADLSVRQVPAALAGFRWVLADSGVRRELAGSAYRTRVRECAEGLAAVRATHPGVRGFRDLDPAHLAGLDPPYAPRLGHVISENARVLALERALAAGDGAEAGRLLCASHRSLRDAYEVSCPELDLLADLAAAWPGCAGARMIGGGFGGCTLSLLRDEGREGFEGHLAAGFAARFGRAPRVLDVALVDGAGGKNLGPCGIEGPPGW